ncbi:MAG: hypothetical protein GY757_15975, partial [bacterium]|nr:hypothetical protein [bacterium]
RLKGDDRLKSIPVVVLTASVMKNQECEAKTIGCDGYLKKPVNKAELLTELMRFLPYANKSTAKETIPEKNAAAKKHTGDDTQSLLPETKEKLPEIFALLEGPLTDKWKEIKVTFCVEDIEDFAAEVNELVDTYHLDIFALWAEGLTEQVQSFDMVKLPATLEQFPELVNRIEQLIANEEK